MGGAQFSTLYIWFMVHWNIKGFHQFFWHGAEKIIIDTCQNTHINLLFIFNKVKTFHFYQKHLLVAISEGTGTRNTREPTHIWLFYAELELTNPSRVDILPEPYPTNLVPVPSLIAATQRFFRENLSQIISAIF